MRAPRTILHPWWARLNISFFGIMKNVIQNNVMIEGFHGRKVSYCGLLGCYTVYSGRWVPTGCVYPEDEGRMFLWNVHTQLPDCAVSHEAAPHTVLNTVFHVFTPLLIAAYPCRPLFLMQLILPRVRCSRFLWNVGTCLIKGTVSHPRRQ